MSLQEEAVEIVEKVSEKLDPLFYSYGFRYKKREAEPSIFTEQLIYQKENIEWRITVCMHPHDYPNTIDIRMIKKLTGNWMFYNLPDLIAIADKTVSFKAEDFMIYPLVNFDNTIKNICRLCDSVLQESL